ncbi:MAG: ATP-binding protein [Clostridiales bacterium]|nr:ATP-binding protein [Clostridiales bacterium]
MTVKRPPVGIEDFEKLRSENFYYVDKTGLIKELLENWGEVNLFTRPRRFGKSLNMSMLKSFFEVGTDKHIFDGLAIAKETALCEKHMGQYPVISLSLKDVSGLNYRDTIDQMWDLIQTEAERFDYLQDSQKLNARDKKNMMQLSEGKGNLESSLHLISRLLYKHFEKKVIILIDEYDVPLQKAEANGCYDEMSGFFSRFFSNGMKTNANMQFAVVTGCLRIAKESIFTGFNNPKVHSIIDDQYDEWFGFTDADVRQMLHYYGMDSHYETTREWYDGYRFGRQNVYCPWDVTNWCDQLRRSENHVPRNFWANSSSNDLILRFVEIADDTTKAELEELSEGKSVNKNIQTELTYADIDRSIDNLWSVLLTTGYLTYRGINKDGSCQLVIPNREIRGLFDRQIKNWFFTKIEGGLKPLFQAFDAHRIADIETCINVCLIDSISFMDGGNSNEMKETFYHGLLLGMLRGRSGWLVKSNREAGNGRADIILIDRFRQCGHIIEVKYADSFERLRPKALEGVQQILSTLYDEYFSDSGIETIYHYGIAFHQKRCVVVDAK